ncbi:MAG TPA: hypothetical protein DDZ89_02690 [Clostridiales bacterium]|nr:hypothetical protein [Clostridiales bacterium]
MNNKWIVLLLIVSMLIIFAGCGTTGEDKDKKDTTKNETDAVSSASIVGDKESFKKAISKDGTWIICATDDITFTEDIILEGDFTHNEQPARKIALYEQDDKRNKTASYKLQAPTLSIRSKNAKLQGGTFVGDVYVEANGFTLVDGKIDGNLYFMNEEFQGSFKLDEGASVTGETKLKKKNE